MSKTLTPAETPAKRTNAKTPAKRTNAKTEVDSESTKLVANDTPDYLMGYEGGTGFEETNSETFALPMMRMLQTTSPQVDVGESEYIEGAKPGMLMFTTTREVVAPESLEIQFCHFKNSFLKWAPRNSAEKLCGVYSLAEKEAMLASGEIFEFERKLVFAEGVNQEKFDLKACYTLVDTRNHYAIVTNTETGEQFPVMLSLNSTQIKKSTALMTTLNQLKVQTPNGKKTPPTWASKFKVKSVKESNSEGSWYGYMFERIGYVGAEDFAMGKEFHGEVTDGQYEVDFESESN